MRGTVAELRAAGHEVRPCRITIEGDLPHGSGLSSSAALEAALCLALLEDDDVDRVELAKLCSRVENDHVGARTGLLDQLAVLCGEEGRALRIDFRDLAIDAGAAGARRLAPRHARLGRLARARGRRLQRAPRGVRRRLRGARDRQPARRGAAPTACPAPLDRRVRHVLSENARVDAMAEALAAGDLERAGALLDASHASLRDDYEASVPEVERTVAALKDAGAAGARMVGGGFGGSVLALFPPGATPPDGSVSVAPGPAARRL